VGIGQIKGVGTVIFAALYFAEFCLALVSFVPFHLIPLNKLRFPYSFLRAR